MQTSTGKMKKKNVNEIEMSKLGIDIKSFDILYTSPNPELFCTYHIFS